MQDCPAGDGEHGGEPNQPSDIEELPDVEEMEEFLATFTDQDSLFELAKSNSVSTEVQETPDANTGLAGGDAVVSASDPESASTTPTPPSSSLPLRPPLQMPLQFITLGHAGGCQCPTVTISQHSLIALALSGSAASTTTYILVPTTSPPPVPTPSPARDAVAPLLLVSAPQGSISGDAGAGPAPQFPPTERVEDYIVKAKAQMEKTCLQLEGGLSLRSHYVDTLLVLRDVLHSRKKGGACLEELLAHMGDTARQKASLRRSQIFGSSAGSKPNRSVLVLGHAGTGKTALIQSLGLDWSTGSFPQFDFFFVLDGKGLALTKPAFSLPTMLLGGLFPGRPLCLDPHQVFSRVAAAPQRVLVVFDGFQEAWHLESLLQPLDKSLVADLQKDTRKQAFTVRELYSALLQRALLPGCTLMIAARPRGATGNLRRWADSLFELGGFSPTEADGALSRYFSEPTSHSNALTRLQGSPYMSSLCWNPALFRLVCFVLEHCDHRETLPDTLSGLCHRALRLKLARQFEDRSSHDPSPAPSRVKLESTVPRGSGSLKHVKVKKVRQKRLTRSCNREARTTGDKVKEKERKKIKSNGGRDEEGLLAELSRLAWEGVRQNDLVLPPGGGSAATAREVGLKAELFHALHLGGKPKGGSRQGEGGGQAGQMESADAEGHAGGEGGRRGSEERKNPRRRTKSDEVFEDVSEGSHVLSWSNPFLQSFLAGLHISSTRKTSGLLKTFPMQVGLGRGRRRTHKEELDLVQRFAIGTLFLRAGVSRESPSKQSVLVKHLKGHLGQADHGAAHLLEVCHCIYETGISRADTHWGTLLAGVLPKEMSFRGVRMWPSDVHVVGKVLELVGGGTGGAGICLGLEDTGIRTSGILSLLGLSNIASYRACTADVISMWEELEEKEELKLKGAMSKFKLNTKATQVCHVDDLARLVSMHRRLTDSSSQSDSLLASGVPAVKELHKLEFELGPEDCTLALPKLWSLLPGLNNLRHLDLEKSEVGDEGAEALAGVLVSLSHLEILNLSQNGIGDPGMYELSLVLMNPASLRCLSLYSNIISDVGAHWLATVLPLMVSLTDLDVKYNNLTDVGAQSLGAVLKKCPSVKSLRMWNTCISFAVFERLQKQDSRIVCH
ncbi:LOW QUALITY PROTEIN: MHC class II transactivator [Gadus chalcogrammus]|uniref:LOW QUALITY PROTEIN: MHC class II transactivator n=1 Tax=Gadus chalcogrammus TaxID=1042646 RepID=UPI0024C3C65F|nr:LOW QUALITY PROTEIN: MHC class II transactivator [Gadus chalcogrammus]